MEISDRMKQYEFLCRTYLLPLTPVIVRLDGRHFHSFCRKLEKPFDQRMHTLMVKTAEHLVKECNAKIGYTQSDEISLLLFSDHFESKIYFDGNVNKIISSAAAAASVFFNRHLSTYLPEKAQDMPTFDARCCNYPISECANYFIWREQDAKRNSILAAADHFFGYSAIQNLKCDQLQEKLLREKQWDWNDYPYYQKRGTYVQHKRVFKKFTADELDTLPPKHHARLNPDLEMERQVILIEEVPPLVDLANRTEFLFSGATPESRSLETKRRNF
jgi:tRNA(His) 5'-end guanylyltransferase